jgi:menaquinone-dependent protoporphyrinogen IX oxidase
MRIIIVGSTGEGKTSIANVIASTLAQIGIATEIHDPDGSPDLSQLSYEDCQKILGAIHEKHVQSGVPVIIETRQARNAAGLENPLTNE